VVLGSWFGSIYRILVSKDQGNDQTKNTDGRHHSENCWDAKLTFQDRQNKDAESRTDFSNTSGETAGTGPQLRWKQDRRERKRGGVRSGVH
jgi:hypothetical protein